MYLKAIAINPEYANAYNKRGWAKLQLGDEQGAFADYKKQHLLDINQQHNG